MNYIKSPHVIFIATVCLTLLFVFTLLRPDSSAQAKSLQTISTVGGRYQLLMPTTDTYVVFDTATARTWRYFLNNNQIQIWTEISPDWVNK